MLGVRGSLQSVLDERCPKCRVRMAYGKSNVLDLCEPSVTIVDVPALLCGSCGTWSLPGNIEERLVIVLEAAIDHAKKHRLGTLQWSFTPEGPPEIGGIPSDLRDLFAKLRALSRHERAIVASLKRGGDGEPPRWFH